jgi:hypothetical protein
MHKRTRPLLTSPPKGGGGSTGRTAKSASTGKLPFSDEEFVYGCTTMAMRKFPPAVGGDDSAEKITDACRNQIIKYLYQHPWICLG